MARAITCFIYGAWSGPFKCGYMNLQRCASFLRVKRPQWNMLFLIIIKYYIICIIIIYN